MPEYIYVLGMDGKPQMPTRRRRHVNKLLNTGKARIAEHVPFTIQLLYENNPTVQPVMMAEDPGRTNIGTAVVGLKGQLYLSAVVETRNKEIRKLMDKRRACRRASRNGERKARQRRAKRFGTMLKAGMLMRKLPQYGEDGFITCHMIRNTEARFCNRKRPKNWVTPTVEQLIRTHINLVHKIQKFLPITDVAIEVNRFAFMLLDDPTVAGVDFQKGPLKGYSNVNDAVFDQQDGKCLLCGQPIEHYHHIIPKSKGGSNTLGNIAGLCYNCHDTVHKNEDVQKALKDKKSGLMKKYAALSALNQAIPFIYKRLVEEFGKEHVFTCTGRETAMVRKSLGFTKTKQNQLHETDAYCIALLALGCTDAALPTFEYVYQMKQFRRQNRANINNQRERSYYYEGRLVAKKKPSVDVLFYRLRKVPGIIIRLDVWHLGAVFYCNGKHHVLNGQITNGQYFKVVGDAKTNYPAKKCRIVKQNEGLVFLG